VDLFSWNSLRTIKIAINSPKQEILSMKERILPITGRISRIFKQL